MNSKFKNICAITILALAIVVYRIGLLKDLFGWSNSTAQFALVLPVLFSLYLISFGLINFSRAALLSAAIVSLGLGLASSHLESDYPSSIKIYLSPFVSDSNEAQTIKFSDLLRKNFVSLKIPLNLERLPNPISSSVQSQEIMRSKLADNPSEENLIIFGSPRWLSFSVSHTFSERLVSKSLKKILSTVRLELATSVSGVGVSDGFSEASREYVSRIAAGFADLSRGEFASAEMDIADAASVQGRWTATGHRSYALWLLGTLYISKAFNEERFEPAYLKCAIDYLTRARKLIRKNEEPELLAAILNNRAVANFLGNLFLGNKKMRKQALKEFKAAGKLNRKKASISNDPAWITARKNLYILNQPKKLKVVFKNKLKKKNKKALERKNQSIVSAS